MCSEPESSGNVPRNTRKSVKYRDHTHAEAEVYGPKFTSERAVAQRNARVGLFPNVLRLDLPE